MWNGKRIDRIEMPRQLRLDQDLGRVIRTRAGLNRRTIQQEILHLLEFGLKSETVVFRQPGPIRAPRVEPQRKQAKQGGPL
jgi:hypothetical protein